MKKKQILAAVVASAMAAGVLAGCGSSSSSSTSSSQTASSTEAAASDSSAAAQETSSSSSGETQKLTLWLPPFAGTDSSVSDADFWAEQVKPFEEENNVQISIEITPWDNYEEKYLTGTSSNDGPDVGYLYMEMFYDYINNDMLVDLDQFFTDEEKENYRYYSLGNIQGGQYGLPFVVGNPRVLIANMDILNQAGIDKVPTTWDELEAAGQAVLDNVDGVAPLMQDWGNPHYGSLNEIYWPYFWGAGASIVDDDGNLTIDSDEGLQATEYLKKLKDEGIIPDSSTSNDDTLQSFKNGEAAMIYAATSNALKIEGINWDYAPIVEGPAGDQSKTFVAADCLVMFQSCENQDLAAKLIKFLTSKDVMGAFHNEISQQPAITVDDDITTSDEKFDDLFTNYADNMQALPVFSNASGMYDTLFKNLQSMMLGDMEPADVLSETTEYYNDNLKD